MEPALKRLLEAADDKENFECPSSFDWNEATERVRALKQQAESITGRAFVIDDNVQDASFFADLSLRRPGALPNHIETVVALRFSCFGNFFTTWSHCAAEQLEPATIQQLVDAATGAGFCYVPITDLDEAYTGQHPTFANSSWWYRFFDYN